MRVSTQRVTSRFMPRIYKGGLPGLGWKTDKPELATGALDSPRFDAARDGWQPATSASTGGRLVLVEASGQEIPLKKIARHGVTLGKAAPAGAKSLVCRQRHFGLEECQSHGRWFIEDGL